VLGEARAAKRGHPPPTRKHKIRQNNPRASFFCLCLFCVHSFRGSPTFATQSARVSLKLASFQSVRVRRGSKTLPVGAPLPQAGSWPARFGHVATILILGGQLLKWPTRGHAMKTCSCNALSCVAIRGWVAMHACLCQVAFAARADCVRVRGARSRCRQRVARAVGIEHVGFLGPWPLHSHTLLLGGVPRGEGAGGPLRLHVRRFRRSRLHWVSGMVSPMASVWHAALLVARFRRLTEGHAFRKRHDLLGAHANFGKTPRCYTLSCVVLFARLGSASQAIVLQRVVPLPLGQRGRFRSERFLAVPAVGQELAEFRFRPAGGRCVAEPCAMLKRSRRVLQRESRENFAGMVRHCPKPSRNPPAQPKAFHFAAPHACDHSCSVGRALPKAARNER
jgi:hypothetical protein